MVGQTVAMSSSFTAISKDLADVDTDAQQIALESQPDVSELAFAVHSLTRCVERLLGQVTTLKFEVASLRLVEHEQGLDRASGISRLHQR